MKKKHNVIGIDARFLLRPLRGMPTYVYMLCKHLPAEFPDTHFVFFINKCFEHNDSAGNYERRLVDVASPVNVTVVNIDSEGEVKWEQLYLPRALKTYNVDLLHMPGNRVCFFTRTKQVVTFHDVMEWKYLKLFSNYSGSFSLREKQFAFRKRMYSWLTYKLGLRRAEHILTISEYSLKDICKVFPEAKSKISYVYHGIPSGFTVNKEISGSESREGVLMLGGDSIQKNPENMIEAWHALPGHVKRLHKLTIVGFTGGENSPIRSTIKRLNCEREVTLQGWITESELVELMNRNRAFLFASREEGFGFPLVQAMNVGIPVVTSTADVLLEIGRDAVLSAPADNPKALASCLNKLLVEDEIWGVCQKNGLKRATLFTWKNTAEAVGRLYSQVIN